MRWIALQVCMPEAGPAVPDDAAAQHSVASLALVFTPRVALLDEAVLLDVTGSLRLFGGLARLAQLLEAHISLFFESHQLVAQVQRAQGATSLIAIGRLRLQHCQSPVVKTRVSQLPMHTLSAARPHLDVLERIGCRTWDDLLKLPRDGVARRFGAGLLAALDRARGTLPDSYDWLVLPEQFEEKIELETLVSHAPALMEGINRLLVRLQAWLLGRQSGLCALKIIWHLDKRRDVAPSGELEIRTDQPAQDLRHVARLISEHLARQKLPAPVHSLSLLSLVTERLADAATATGSLLMQEQKHGEGSALELIERLSARLGDANVLAWQAAADHRPEHMQRWVHAKSCLATIKAVAAHTRRASAVGMKGLKTEVSPFNEALYPSWLLPQPLQLATHGNSPVYQGRLTRMAGPQRLEASGWLMDGECVGQASKNRQNPPAMRDYYIYRSQQGSLLWIYSERLAVGADAAATQRAWYLHGFFA
ncbi:MAG: DNA polymerase Y family protein [Pseudomonadota bacterium]